MKDKRRKIVLVLTCMCLLIVLPVLARLIRDFIEIFKFSPSKIPSGYIFTLLKDINTYIQFFTKVDPPNVLGWIICGWYILMFIFNSFGVFKVHEKYVQNDEYGSHGTARWKTDKEIKNDFYNDKLGWFLGSVEKNKIYKVGMDAAYLPVNGKLNMQVTVIGPPGSQKTTGFVLNNIFHLPYAYKCRNELIDKYIKDSEEYASTHNKFLSFIHDRMKGNDKYKKLSKEMPDLVLTDPKPELFPRTAAYLEEMGYEVKVLDFIDFEHGDKFNALDFITQDKELIEIAHNYVDSVEGSGGASGDQAFWNSQEEQVLAALIGFVKQKYPKERQTFTEVAKILTSPEVKNIESAESFFEDNNIKGAAKQLWNNFLMIADSERTRANILGGLATKLKLFAIEGVQNITSSTTVDITKLGAKKEKPMALFIFMPISDKTFAPIINVIISTIHRQYYKTANKTHNRLENPIYEILEEMANIGRISNIQEMLGTMRGLRIYPMMIWQSLSQMKDRYKDGWEDMLSMCDTHIYLGINDEFTANKCSNLLGDTTIKIQGISQRAEDGLFTIKQKTESNNCQKRKLLLPDECMSMDNDKLIFRLRANNPSLLYKVQYKYWLDDVEICRFKEVTELPKLNNEKDKEKMEYVNIITDKNNEKDLEHENIKKSIELEKEIEIPVEEENRQSVDYSEVEIDTSLLEGINGSIEIEEYEYER